MSLPRRSLEKRYQYPWNLRIDEDALDLAAGKTRPEDLEDEVSGEEDDTYNAAFGFNNPRKRKATSHANAGSPTPSKKKSSIKFAPQEVVTPAESLEDDIFDFDSDDSNEIKDGVGDPYLVRSLPLFFHDTWLIRHVELGEVELGVPAEASLVL
jgi:hypothetical protein